MTPPNRSNQHASYLLRVWRANEGTEWRIFVENVHTGEARGFNDINALVAFLQEVSPKTNGADSTERGSGPETQ